LKAMLSGGLVTSRIITSTAPPVITISFLSTVLESAHGVSNYRLV
jgi:hypothetical protein